MTTSGWYKDPEGDGVRYWDGRAWTSQTAERERLKNGEAA